MPSAQPPPEPSKPPVVPSRPSEDAGDGGSLSAPLKPSPPKPSRPSRCPEAAPVAAPGQVIALRSVNFQTSEVVLQNVSDGPVTIPGREWQWCQFPAYWYVITEEGADVTLEPGETFAFFPSVRTKDGAVQPMPAAGQELAIYVDDGGYLSPDRMLAFLTWGSGPPINGRESVAAQAGLWTLGDRPEVGPAAAGMLAVGLVNRAEGYVSVFRGCLDYDAAVRP